jgi:signal transduction histidine kinase/DNA-binding response OmpR family regulator
MAAGFSLLLLMLVGIGGVGLLGMRSLTAHVDEIVDTRWAMAQRSREALDYSNRNNRITMEVFFLRDRAAIDPLLAERARNTDEISRVLKHLRQQAATAEERQILDDIGRDRAPYVESYQHALRLLLEQGDPEGARIALVGETLPYLSVYHNDYNQLVAYEGTQMDRAARAARDAYGRAQRQVGLLLACAIALAVGIGTVTTQRIRGALADQRRAEDALHLANEQLEARVAARTRELERTLGDLRDARDQALASARAKAAFLANMSHEIRTPMNGVIGMTGILLESSLSEEQRDYAETIRASGESLLTILNDILDLSKMEAGKLVFEQLDFDLQDTIETALSLVADRAQPKGLELAAWIAPEVPKALRGDPGRLGQVLNNLLSNAVKFTPAGEVIVRVSLEECHRSTTRLRFEVSDTGVGIPVEARARLFESFTQADESTTRQYGGTGLGLAIAKHLVEIMRGTIGINCTDDRGSTFWFTAEFQLASVDVRRDSDVALLAHLAGVRVLIVDDNLTNRRILEHQVHSWHMRPSSVADADEAEAALASGVAARDPFAVALVDLQMPAVDGLTLARTIRSDARFAATKVLLLTSLGQPLTADERRDAGIEECLLKPIKTARLRSALLRIVAGSSDSEQPIVEPSSSSAVATTPGMRLLLAEDNVVNQKVMITQLKQLGYHVDVVANGEEAVAAAERLPYELLLLDCQMPVMDGYSAARHLRAGGFTSDRLTIIALTAHALEGDRDKCLEAGMDDYLTKPVRRPDLVAMLNKWDQHRAT